LISKWSVLNRILPLGSKRRAAARILLKLIKYAINPRLAVYTVTEKFKMLLFRVLIKIDTVNEVKVQEHYRQIETYNEKGFIFIRGWAIDKKIHGSLSSISIIIDNKEYKADIGLERSDIAKKFKSAGYAQSGFKVAVPVRDLSGNIIIPTLKAVTKSNDQFLRPCFKILIRESPYYLWMSKNEVLEQQLCKQKVHNFRFQPLLSIIIRATVDMKNLLPELLESIRNQIYSHFEIIIAGSKMIIEEVNNICKSLYHDECFPEITPVECELEADAIPYRAVRKAAGDYISIVNGCDTLAPDALFELVRMINKNRNIDFIYSDEDAISINGKVRFNPQFKPQWSPDTLRSYNYIGHLVLFKNTIIKRLSSSSIEDEDAAYYDLVLRCSEIAQDITHIPKILYHKRERKNIGLHVNLKMTSPLFTTDGTELHSLLTSDTLSKYTINRDQNVDIHLKPDYSIIILNVDSSENIIPLVESLIDLEKEGDIEIIIGDKEFTNSVVKKFYESEKSKIRVYNELSSSDSCDYNFLVSRYAHGKFLGFLKNSMRIQSVSFIDSVKSAFKVKNIGCIGTILVDEYSNLKYGGTFIEEHDHHKYLPSNYVTDNIRDIFKEKYDGNVPALTGTCLFCRKDDFIALDGFDENYKNGLYDVDFCLKFLRFGRKNIILNEENRVRGTIHSRMDIDKKQKDYEYYLWKWKTYLDAEIMGSKLNKMPSGAKI